MMVSTVILVLELQLGDNTKILPFLCSMALVHAHGYLSVPAVEKDTSVETFFEVSGYIFTSYHCEDEQQSTTTEQHY